MKSKDLFVVSLFTLITVVAWIVFDIYHTATVSNISNIQQELIIPLDPTFDQETINKLK